jgi:hypothetical protein
MSKKILRFDRLKIPDEGETNVPIGNFEIRQQENGSYSVSSMY